MAITLIQAALHISGFRIHGFNQLWIKYIQKSIPESSKNQNLHLPHIDSYLRIVYVALCITSNLEMI